MANKNITIPVKDIKAVMKDYYEMYVFSNDETIYRNLFAAISTFHDAGLISDEDYKKIFDYDNKLFKIVCEAE